MSSKTKENKCPSCGAISGWHWEWCGGCMSLTQFIDTAYSSDTFEQVREELIAEEMTKDDKRKLQKIQESKGSYVPPTNAIKPPIPVQKEEAKWMHAMKTIYDLTEAIGDPYILLSMIADTAQNFLDIDTQDVRREPCGFNDLEPKDDLIAEGLRNIRALKYKITRLENALNAIAKFDPLKTTHQGWGNDMKYVQEIARRVIEEEK